MKIIEGWNCPDLLSGPGNYLGRCPHADLALKRVREWGCCIQAGGHIGTVPVYLSSRFARVYTFEPDPENFACLVANAYERAAGRIIAAQGVLGAVRQPVAMLRSKKSTGQHRVLPGTAGDLPTYRIDDLGLSKVGAIFLDVEGCEIPVIRGASKTLARQRPVVMAEENRRCIDQGFSIGALERVMAEHDYRRVGRVADDLVFVHEAEL